MNILGSVPPKNHNGVATICRLPENILFLQNVGHSPRELVVSKFRNSAFLEFYDRYAQNCFEESENWYKNALFDNV